MFFKAVFTQAIADRVISPEQNPCLFVLQNRFMQYSATEGNKPDEERIILPATEKIIAEAIRKDHEKDESYMPAYAAELSALTAMRSGELAGLWWKNIDFENGVLNIVQSQKHDETKKIYYISEVKNKKPRQIPMTDDIRELLLRIRSVQEKYGKSGDYVFSTKDGFNNVKQISDYMQIKKVQYKIQQPISIHAQRRTINSRMASQGVADVVRASILGHTTRVNLNNYTNDMTSMYEKQKVLASVGQIC
jgi:integrase